MIKKNHYIILCFCVLFFSYLFPLLIMDGMKSALTWKLQRVFQEKFKVQQIQWKYNTIVFQNVISSSKKYVFKNIKIQFFFGKEQKLFSWDMHLTNPEVTISCPAQNVTPSSFHVDWKKLLFLSTIDTAQISFATAQGPYCFFLSLENTKNTKEKKALLWFDKDQKQKFCIHFLNTDEHLQCQASFSQLNAKFFENIISFLQKKSFLEKFEGEISGNIAFIVDQNQILVTRCEGCFEKFSFYSPILQWEVEGNLFKVNNLRPFIFPKDPMLWTTLLDSEKIEISLENLLIRREQNLCVLQKIQGKNLSELQKNGWFIEAVAEWGNYKEALSLALSREDDDWHLTCNFPSTSLQFHLQPSETLIISLENFTPYYFSFFQKIFGNVVPVIHTFAWEKGNIEALIVTQWKQRALQSLCVKKLFCHNIQVVQKEHNLCFSCESFQGIGQFDVAGSDNFFCDLIMHKGAILTPDKEITQLTTEWKIEKGVVTSSQTSFLCNQMQGNIEVQGPIASLQGYMRMQGSVDQFMKMAFPEKKLLKNMQDAFSFGLHIQQKKGNFILKGDMSIGDKQKEKLLFDCTIAFMEIQKLSLHALQGTIKGSGIDLQRWNSLLGLQDVALEGIVDIEGKLEKAKGSFYLIPQKQLFYLSPDFTLTIDTLQKDPIYMAYSLEEQKFHCYIPTFVGNFSLPAFASVFQVKDADILIEDTSLVAHVPICESSNVIFSGNVFLQLEEKFPLDIHVESFAAKVEDITTFMQPFTPFYKKSTAVQGDIKGSFDYSIFLQAKEQIPIFSAEILTSNVSYAFSDLVKIQQLEGKFSWNTQDNSLDTQAVSAEIVVGDGVKNYEVYNLSCPLLKKKSQEDLWQFDIRLERKMWSILRLVGNITKEKQWKCNFSSDLCHLFGSPFIISDLVFDPLGNLEHLLCNFTLENDQLLHHLEFLMHMQILPWRKISSVCFPSIQGKIQSVFEIDKNYDFSMHAKAKDIKINEQKYSAMQVAVKKQKDSLTIEDFQIDDIKGSVCFLHKDKHWEIKEGKLRKQKQMHFFFEGNVEPEKSIAFLRFFDCKVDITKFLSHFPNLSLPAKGKVEGDGEITFFLPTKEKSFSYASNWFLHLTNFSLHSLEIENKQPLHLHFSKEKGLQIYEVDLHCYHSVFHPHLFNFRCDKIQIDDKFSKIHCQDSKIYIPLKVVDTLLHSQQLQKCSSLYEFIEFVQRPFSLEKDIVLLGDIYANLALNSLQAVIPTAHLFLNGKQRDFKDISFSFENGASVFDFSYLYNQHYYKITSWMHFSSPFYGRISVLEEEKMQKKKNSALSLQWQWQDNQGLLIQNIQGSCAGMDVSFHIDEKQQQEENIQLMGSMKMDIAAMQKLFPEQWQRASQFLRIGKGLELRGKIILPKKELDWFAFEGSLAGKHFEVGEYYFKTLLSHISINPKKILFQDFKMSDKAGIISVDQILCQTEDFEKWAFSIPCFLAQDIRPSLIEKIHQEQEEEMKPLLIRHFKLENITGNLDDPYSIRGVGEMDFVNSFKRGTSIFDIPADFLGKIVGLDQELLIPVKGKLEFVLQKGKIFFTNLSDAFSENNRSQFFLMTDEHEPFMDFDGNIKMYIRMKQFVLFKFTENFIISIGRNIRDPDIKLHRKKGIFSFHD